MCVSWDMAVVMVWHPYWPPSWKMQYCWNWNYDQCISGPWIHGNRHLICLSIMSVRWDISFCIICRPYWPPSWKIQYCWNWIHQCISGIWIHSKQRSICFSIMSLCWDMVVFHNLTSLSSLVRWRHMTSYCQYVIDIFDDKTTFPLGGHVDWGNPGTWSPYPYLYPFLRYSKNRYLWVY